MTKETVTWTIITAIGSLLGAAGAILTGVGTNKVTANLTAPKAPETPAVPPVEEIKCPECPETK